jgi:DNA-directed RNA polymerase subunit RPC12/RpoP
MLKLPLCPYCGARFLYPDVKKSKNTKQGICPHCGGIFRIYGRTSRFALYTISSLLLIGMNLCLIKIPSINLTVLFSATILGVMVTRLLIPYTVRYGPL